MFRRLYWILVIVFIITVIYKGTYTSRTPYIYLAMILSYPYAIRWIVKITRATRMADVKLDYVNKEEELVNSLKH